MKWICCKCEDKYVANVDGDAEERMCYLCIDEVRKEYEKKGEC